MPVLLRACLVLALTGCGGSPERVHVYNWNDYIADEVLERFERETGIGVVYDVYDSNEMLESQLLAGSSGYDVVFPTARPYAARQIEAGIYAPLEASRLENIEHLDGAILDSLRDIDPGNRHVLPYSWGTSGLGYNVDAVEARLGEDFDIDSWNMLFDPQAAEVLADCGIALLDDPEELLHAALMWLGEDGSTAEPEKLEAAVEAYHAVRPHIRYFHSSQYVNDLANGDVCLAMGFSGDVLQARDRAREADRGVEVGYALPREGALMWVDLMAIPADAPNPAAAHAFIDFLMRPEMAAAITNEVRYASANASALPHLDPEIRNDPLVYPEEETRAHLQRARPLSSQERRARMRAYERIRTGG